jgi:DNA ligase-1
MSVKKIFDEIAAEPGTNKKMEILGKYKDNELLREVLYLANSKRVKFYIKQIPAYKPSELGDTYAMLDHNIKSLKKLSDREVTGHAAITHLSRVLEYSSVDDAYIIERIIEKDCKIGMGTTNMNKIFAGLIEKTPYMGAKAFEPKLAQAIFQVNNNPYHYSQIKMDGRYSNAIIRGGDVELESRQGEVTMLEGAKFLEELKGFPDCVLNGEFTIDGLSRYESNGIIASLVSIGDKKLEGKDIAPEIAKLKKKHNVEYQAALDSIKYTVWDTISVDEYFETKSKTPYNVRFETNLQELIATMEPTMVQIVETRMVKSYEEAIAHFQEVLNKGFEGTILKSYAGTWKDGKPNWQVKMKLEMDVDLKITGFNLGTGKNAALISSLNAESADGKVVTSPTGIDEATMKYITDNQADLLGVIVAVKCSGLSKDSKGQYSLLHPVYKGLRKGEKTETDTLEDIIANENMIKGLS